LLFFFLKRKEVVSAVYFLFGGGYRVQKKEGFLRNSFLAKKTRISCGLVVFLPFFLSKKDWLLAVYFFLVVGTRYVLKGPKKEGFF